MKSLLVLNSSARLARSHTRDLTRFFADGWLKAHPKGTVVHRDVGLSPVPSIDEAWIRAAFAPDNGSVESGALGPLALSNALIAELDAADEVVIGAPIYNFGMPAALKAYIDQIVRAGVTFRIDASQANPYVPLLRDRPVTVIVSSGTPEMHPGGNMYSDNFLEGNLSRALGFIGLADLRWIYVADDELPGTDTETFRNRALVAIEERIRGR
ncbi:MAG: NAD(P)H-dependent oxidoreductase [Opitutaceae bacterium]|nr:NAD(P)H-dependent oxidoreductase [Opitutaceae bacterium]